MAICALRRSVGYAAGTGTLFLTLLVTRPFMTPPTCCEIWAGLRENSGCAVCAGIVYTGIGFRCRRDGDGPGAPLGRFSERPSEAASRCSNLGCALPFSHEDHFLKPPPRLPVRAVPTLPPQCQRSSPRPKEGRCRRRR